MPGTTLLLGDETVEATTVANAAEKIKYHRFTALATGIVEVVELRVVSMAASEPELGIFADSGEAPGTLLAHVKHAKTVGTTENAWLAFEGFSLSVTVGTVYWIGFEDSVELKYASLTGTTKNTRKGSGAKATLTSSPAVEALATPEKISVKALGTPVFSGALLGSLAVTSVLSGLKVAAAALTTKVAYVGSLVATKTAVGSLTSKTALSTSVSGAKTASGAIKGSLAVTSTFTGTIGSASFSGALLSQLAVKGSLTGRKIAMGELPPYGMLLPFELPLLLGYPPGLAITTTLTGSKLGRGALTSSLAIRGTIAGAKTARGALTSTFAARSTTSGRKLAGGTLTGRLAITTILLGGLATEAKPCRIALSSHPGVSMTLTGRKAVVMTLSSRPAVEIALEAT